jgi:hypothetical protein
MALLLAVAAAAGGVTWSLETRSAYLVPRGSHVENDAAFFLAGQADRWLGHINAWTAGIRKEQRPDGSFRYAGPRGRTHFEDTASGFCALSADRLLEHALYTGDAGSAAAGIRALEFMKRFRTPRGGQTWEMPLHTPDLAACAWLVRAYVRGFELTGNRDYFDLARRWAARGLPFVYQWGCFPIMPYATIGALGATDWTGVNWIGLPLPWCGVTYAYSLTMLAEYDHAFDWKRVAEGIERAAEQMQYPDGPFAGCLPDSFSLRNQRRLPEGVDPCTLVALQLRLAGQLDGIAVASDSSHRVVAPFPVKLHDGKALITAVRGLRYQVLVDGKRIVSVWSKGEDEVDLEAAAAP